MELTRKHLTIGLLAVVAVLAAFALAGHPLIDPAALAGIGMVPMAMSGEIDVKKQFEQLSDVAKSAKEAIEQVKKSHTELDSRVEKLQGKLADAVD